LTTLLALCAAFVTEAGTYRYVDEDGTVHYTDVIPPTEIGRGHTEISESGMRMKTVPPAKTMSEVIEEQELARLRDQQERLIEQQRASDRVLLHSFRSEDDLLMARDGKLAAIDVIIQLSRNSIRRHQERLAALQTEAANLERAGKTVPARLKDSIAKTDHSIQDTLTVIAEREAQKRELSRSFELDLQRFRQLSSAGAEKWRVPRNLTAVAYAIMRCRGEPECDRFWERATRYLRNQSKLPVESENASILILGPPAREDDIRPILARIRDARSEDTTLFLDLLCQTTQSGNALCKTSEAEAIAGAFRAAVLGEDSSPEP
jgi:hypothetical protein